jgi:hypothetical protein
VLDRGRFCQAWAPAANNLEREGGPHVTRADTMVTHTGGCHCDVSASGNRARAAAGLGLQLLDLQQIGYLH